MIDVKMTAAAKAPTSTKIITLRQVRYLGEIVSIHDYVRDRIAVFAATTTSADITLDPFEILEAHWFPLDALPPLSGNARQVLRVWQQL